MTVSDAVSEDASSSGKETSFNAGAECGSDECGAEFALDGGVGRESNECGREGTLSTEAEGALDSGDECTKSSDWDESFPGLWAL